MHALAIYVTFLTSLSILFSVFRLDVVLNFLIELLNKAFYRGIQINIKTKSYAAPQL